MVVGAKAYSVHAQRPAFSGLAIGGRRVGNWHAFHLFSLFGKTPLTNGLVDASAGCLLSALGPSCWFTSVVCNGPCECVASVAQSVTLRVSLPQEQHQCHQTGKEGACPTAEGQLGSGPRPCLQILLLSPVLTNAFQLRLAALGLPRSCQQGQGQQRSPGEDHPAGGGGREEVSGRKEVVEPRGSPSP